MAYTWVTGEVITAEKLNNTGNVDLSIAFGEDINEDITLSIKGMSLQELINKLSHREFIQCVFWVYDGTAYQVNSVSGDDNDGSDGICFTNYSNDFIEISIYLDGTGFFEIGNINWAFEWTYDSTTKEYTCVTTQELSTED